MLCVYYICMVLTKNGNHMTVYHKIFQYQISKRSAQVLIQQCRDRPQFLWVLNSDVN